MIRLGTRQLKVLDFDSECRPMHYSEWRAESQLTGIAWSWIGSDKVDVRLLEQDLSNERQLLEDFLEAYNEADIVVGHYVRKHDLPLLADHTLRLGLPILGAKRVQDTMADMIAVKGLGKSQDNLSVTLGVSAVKHHMSGADWRVANALDPAGRAATKKRVVDDVLQNKQLRVELLDRGALKPPRMWTP